MQVTAVELIDWRTHGALKLYSQIMTSITSRLVMPPALRSRIAGIIASISSGGGALLRVLGAIAALRAETKRDGHGRFRCTKSTARILGVEREGTEARVAIDGCAEHRESSSVAQGPPPLGDRTTELCCVRPGKSQRQRPVEGILIRGSGSDRSRGARLQHPGRRTQWAPEDAGSIVESDMFKSVLVGQLA